MSEKVQPPNYQFARDMDVKKRRNLLLVSFGFITLIIFTFLYSSISSLPLFQTKIDRVGRVYDTTEQEKALEQRKKLVQAYENAKIPYDDPAGRFSIIFMTPYTSGRVGVVIKTKNDYDKAKSDAEIILANAKKTVAIDSVSYINNFD